MMVLGGITPCFRASSGSVSGRINPFVHYLFGRLRFGNCVPDRTVHHLAAQLFEQPALLCTFQFIADRVRVLNKVDARDLHTDVTTQPFRREPLVLKDLYPEFAGDLRIELVTATIVYP